MASESKIDRVAARGQWAALFCSDSRAHMVLLGVLAFLLAVAGSVFHHPDTIIGSSFHALMYRGDPAFFAYPALILYLDAAVYGLIYVALLLVGQVHSPAQFEALYRSDSLWGAVPFGFPAQLVTALFSVVAVLVAYRLALRMFRSPAVALLGGLITATSLMWVQQSHYPTPDVPLAALVLVTLLAGANALDKNRLFDWVLTGLAAGFAASAKYGGAAVLLPLALLALSFRPLRLAIRNAVTLASAAALGFVCTNPYIFLSASSFFRDFAIEANRVRFGMMGYYTDSALIYNLQSVWPWAFGLPFLALGLVGGLGLLVDARSSRLELLVLGTIIVFAVQLVPSHLTFERHALPLLPLGGLLAANGARMAWNYLTRALRAAPSLALLAARAALLAIVLIGLGQNTALSVWHDLLLTRTDSRQVVLGATSRLQERGVRDVCAGAMIAGYLSWRGLDVRTFSPLSGPAGCRILLLDSFSLDKYVYDGRYPSAQAQFETVLANLDGFYPSVLSPFSAERGKVPFSPASVYSPALPDLDWRTAPGPYVAFFAADKEARAALEQSLTDALRTDGGEWFRYQNYPPGDARAVYLGLPAGLK